MRRWLIGLTVGLLVAVVGLAIGLSPLGTSFEQGVGLTWLFKLRENIEPPQDAVIVGIESRTGGQLGLPVLPRDWPRSIHAQMIDESETR